MGHRIHGDITICRSTHIPKNKDYTRYRPFLSDDFQNTCGYCGKRRSLSSSDYEIDHFVPQRINSDRVSDYANLVLACKTCNRAKSGDWPTEDKNIPNDGNVGYVDPATPEYDLHLTRDADGNIHALTKVGEYMCDKFHFDCRLISEMWMLMQLDEKIVALDNMDSSTCTPDDNVTYRKLAGKYHNLRNRLVGHE